MKLYRNIFKDALSASWRHKYLWFFGLFTTLLGGGAEADIIFGDYGSDGSGLTAEFHKWAETGVFSQTGLANIGRLATQDPFTFFILISILLVVLVLFLFVLWISLTSQAALVYNAGKIRLDKSHSFKDGLQAGIDHFWPVFSLNIGLKIILGLLFALLSWPIISSQAASAFSRSGLIFILMFLVFIPISIITTFITKYAIAFIVIRGDKFLTALKNGWNLFVANWLVSLEMAFMLFFISFVGALLIIILFLILMAPIMFIVLLFQNVISLVNVFVVLIAIFVLYLLAIITFGSFLTTFKTLSWTNLFIELISKGGVSKLTRIFEK